MSVECNYLLPALVLKNENTRTSIKTHEHITSVKHHTITYNTTVAHQHDFHKTKLLLFSTVEFFQNELTEQ